MPLTHTHTHKSLSRKKSQSAMEYLMTYGWAILIIAVVLGVLFQLGVFSGSALTPKAQPGSCQVQRLLGQVSLEGQCTGLLPQFVVSFNTAGTIATPSSMSLLPLGASQRSEFAWVYYYGPSGSNHGGVAGYSASGCSGPTSNQVSGLMIYPALQVFFWGCNDDYTSSLSVTLNTWEFVGYTYNGFTTVTTYLNGQSQTGVLSASAALNTQASPFTIGQGGGGGFTFNGLIANVQMYNTSLSTNEVKALYMEGIGGVPIRVQNLVGWWPLNGNINDYSGYNYNMQVSGSGTSFNNTWQSAYTPP